MSGQRESTSSDEPSQECCDMLDKLFESESEESTAKEKPKKKKTRENAINCERCLRKGKSIRSTLKAFCPFCNKVFNLCEQHQRTYTLCDTRQCRTFGFIYKGSGRVRKYPNKELEFYLKQNF